MNEHTPPTSAPGTVDDVWGVQRPPVLNPAVGPTPTGNPVGPAGPGGSSTLDRGFAVLQKAPLRRDSVNGVVGGVCAGVARRLDVSPTAIRVAAVALALFFGVGIGAYLLAWAVLPDQGGRTHAEQAVRGGRPRSLVILALGLFAALGIVSWVFDSWPLMIVAAVVAFVVLKKKGHFSTHTHG
ncbi:PspC domain-containing protein [Ornithinimicrobium cerasi]|uniref:Phage shock protein C (PspC) family protein n=1 Tax=Ornithinimicrobium cerasi TaxID=2248773 RepID=A0A285VTE5_9MICO|nr:PspC domain-containing protein [Ornithinimicrobium cerasi]SOC57223.1 phage shock protein C (PspC) family protein [Ornithinimicrobium cerasi]